MTVGELKKALEGVRDDVQVVVPGSDHSYTKISDVNLTSAEVVRFSTSKALKEYYDKESMCDQSNTVIPVVVVS
jgi:hypothetical protein